MGRERKFKGTDAEIALARFLCGITDILGLDTVDKVAERFPDGGSRSKWAEYLNGAKLIPKPLLRDLLQEQRRTRSDSWGGNVLVDANKLWKAAAEGTAPPQDSPSSESISLNRRLADTAEALYKAQSVAMNSNSVIQLLLQFGGRQERKITELGYEVKELREREREQAMRNLEQAQFRLARVQAELERARSDRYTAEQAQTALLREQQEIYQEFERLQQAASGLDIELTLLPERAPQPKMSDEEIDRRMDERLALMSTDREQRGAMLSEVLEQVGLGPETDKDGSRTLSGTVVAEHAPAPGPANLPTPSEAVQELSRTMPASPPTSNDTPAHSPAASRNTFKSRHKIALGGLAIALAGLAVPLAIHLPHDTSAAAGKHRSTAMSTHGSTTVSTPSSPAASKHGNAEESQGPSTEKSSKPPMESPESPSIEASSKPPVEKAVGLITVVSPDTGVTMCVDEDTNKGQNGDVVQLWDCDYAGTTQGQLWTLYSDNTLRVWGKCMDIVGDSKENYAPLRLWDCDHSGGQQWVRTTKNELKNPQSGLCLDVPQAQMDKGTNLEIYRCLGGAWTQQWHFVSPTA